MTDQSTVTFSPGLQNATGKIPYLLSNDIIFHCAAQQSEEFLNRLISDFSGIPIEQIKSVKVLNPIDYRTYTAKEIILDLKVELDDHHIYNFEIQLRLAFNSKWWINRSLLYLCRSYDNLKSGNDYEDILPATQISIVKEDFFPDEPPEFFAEYMFLNTRTHTPYTSHFKMNVLYLNHIDLATQEDIDKGLVIWAKLFQTDTWEELRRLILEHPDYKEVAETMFYVDADTSARSIAEAHEKYLHDVASIKAQARREGLAEGRAEGLAEGHKEGHNEGLKEGYQKAQNELKEADIKIEKLRQKLIAAGISPDE